MLPASEWSDDIAIAAQVTGDKLKVTQTLVLFH